MGQWLDGHKSQKEDGYIAAVLELIIVSIIHVLTKAWSKYHNWHVTDALRGRRAFQMKRRCSVSHFFCVIIELVQASTKWNFIVGSHEEVKYGYYPVSNHWWWHNSRVKVPVAIYLWHRELTWKKIRTEISRSMNSCNLGTMYFGTGIQRAVKLQRL